MGSYHHGLCGVHASTSFGSSGFKVASLITGYDDPDVSSVTNFLGTDGRGSVHESIHC